MTPDDDLILYFVTDHGGDHGEVNDWFVTAHTPAEALEHWRMLVYEAAEVPAGRDDTVTVFVVPAPAKIVRTHNWPHETKTDFELNYKDLTTMAIRVANNLPPDPTTVVEDDPT